jgi:septum formation protein
MTALILASGSRTRAKLLADAGLAFEVMPAGVDEDAVKEAMLADKAGPRAIAEFLAELKSTRVSGARSDALVIGADQVLVFEGRLISKSPDLAAARALLQELSGKTHELVSALTLARDGTTIWHHTEVSRLTLRKLSDAFIDDYLQTGGEELLHSVGCFQLERRGIQLFSRVAGDYFAILGVPLVPLLNQLRELGALPQ